MGTRGTEAPCCWALELRGCFARPESLRYPLMVKDVLVVPYALACLALVAFCEMAAYQVDRVCVDS